MPVAIISATMGSVLMLLFVVMAQLIAGMVPMRVAALSRVYLQRRLQSLLHVSMCVYPVMYKSHLSFLTYYLFICRRITLIYLAFQLW